MSSLSKYVPIMLSVLRIVTALLFIEHGTQKLFGFPPMQMMPGGPGGGGLPPLFMVAGVLEVVGGLLVLIGLFTRPVAFLLSGEMAVAYWMVHFAHGGFFPVANGGDAAVLFCFNFLFLFVAGAGAWSIDAMRGNGGAAKPA